MFTTIRTTQNIDTKQYKKGEDAIFCIPVPGYSAEQVEATYDPDRAMLDLRCSADSQDGGMFSSDSLTTSLLLDARFSDRISINAKNGQAEVTVRGFYTARPSTKKVQIPVEGSE